MPNFGTKLDRMVDYPPSEHRYGSTMCRLFPRETHGYSEFCVCLVLGNAGKVYHKFFHYIFIK